MSTIKEQVDLATANLGALFKDLPAPPPDATVASLWQEIMILKGLNKKPKVYLAAKMLLEDPQLANIPIPLLASLIKSSYEQRGFECDCSSSSVRWYISQHTCDWNITQRA